jgi:peptidoglycan hydrolase CwlO-like protein
MSFWEEVKKDLQKGVKEGIYLLKGKAIVVKEKAEELAEEGKRRYKIFELQTKVQKEITELGGRVYDLSSKLKNPLLDKKVKSLIARIKKLEKQVTKLEKEKKATPKKATIKRVK